MFTYCKQLKLKARDGKYYNTDVIDETGLNTVIALIPQRKVVVGQKEKNCEQALKVLEFTCTKKTNKEAAHVSILTQIVQKSIVKLLSLDISEGLGVFLEKGQKA